MGSATSSSERGNLHKDLLNAWTTDNTTSTIPRFQYGDENSASMSNRFLTSNNSLTFKNISLGYTFPRRLVEKLKLTSLRIYCSCTMSTTGPSVRATTRVRPSTVRCACRMTATSTSPIINPSVPSPAESRSSSNINPTSYENTD